MQKEYSFLIGVEKTLVRLLIIAGPLVFVLFPETWMNVTLGGALTFGLNWLKNYPFSETY